MPPRKGSKKKSTVPPDLLSNLPMSIIAKIIGHVPIRDAVKTSVLSRQWRYIWCSIPNLKFEDSCVNPPYNTSWFNKKFVSFVNRVLLLRQGPVHKFEVSVYGYPEFSDINQWMVFLSRNGIEELSLEFGCKAKAPSSLFQCSKLTSLNLCFFQSLELPVDFDGFMLLKRLVLLDVTIATRSLEELVSGCPLLESLELSNSHSEVLKINAPLLKYLYLEGTFKGFVLEKTPLLKEISVTMYDDVAKHSGSLIKFIDRVPLLENLIGLQYFAKYWNVGEDPCTSAITHNHLQFIKLCIDFEDTTEVCLLIRLMSSSLVLEELEIIEACVGSSSEGHTGSDSEFWREVRNLGCNLSQLKKVTMAASGSNNEIEFMKFVLLNSPALEEMIVTLSSDLKDGMTKVLVSLLRCRRASTKAEVVFRGA